MSISLPAQSEYQDGLVWVRTCPLAQGSLGPGAMTCPSWLPSGQQQGERQRRQDSKLHSPTRASCCWEGGPQSTSGLLFLFESGREAGQANDNHLQKPIRT